MSDAAYRLRTFWYSFFSRGTVVTTLIVGSLVAVFVVQLLFYYIFSSDFVDAVFALSRPGLALGAWWQLLTYGWLHSETLLIHILFNVLMIRSLGPALEWPLGPLAYLGLYLGSVVAAAAAWLLFQPHAQGAIVGASGAVFGLVAAYGTYEPRRPMKVFVLFVIPMAMTARGMALFLVGVEVVCQVMGWLPSIGHVAHLGGALFGFLFMWAWKRKHRAAVPIDPHKSFSQPPGSV